MSRDVLQELVDTIRERRSAPAGSSYTQKLLSQGVTKCASKMGEEAVELAIAAVAEDDDAVVGEAADLLFHTLVLLEARGIAFDDVLARLVTRQGVSGLAEKASRSSA